MPDLTLERRYRGLVAGVDEAGRGPWAGPVIAAAVILPNPLPSDIAERIDDSKVVRADRRIALHDALCACAKIGVGRADVDEIDEVNILEATMRAMTRAVVALGVDPEHVLVDGNRIPDWPFPATAIVKGDARCMSIAAASIAAKVTRDRLMADLALSFPGYGWERNAGYGTAAHRLALDRLGVTPHHRRSFAPIRKMLYRS